MPTEGCAGKYGSAVKGHTSRLQTRSWEEGAGTRKLEGVGTYFEWLPADVLLQDYMYNSRTEDTMQLAISNRI
jgi:hypothetical protein